MPLYEFRCPSGHDFEKFYRSIGAAVAEEKCPECGALATRLMSTAGLVFKGSGFYITDYGKDGKKAERDAASAKASATAGEPRTGDGKTGDGKSGEAKPAEAATKSSDPAPAAAKAPEASPVAAAPKKASTPKETG